jgi:hypothetical protein
MPNSSHMGQLMPQNKQLPLFSLLNRIISTKKADQMGL